MLGSNLPGIILTVGENVTIKGLVLYQPFDIFRDLSCLNKNPTTSLILVARSFLY